MFGRYALLERLAVGGMAEILLARARGEAGFERVCVIKRVLPHLAANPRFVTMFLDEARLAARLHHPGIAQIFDLGRHEDDYFIAMEYLAGEDLSSILGRSATLGLRMPLPVAAAIIQGAASALHHAHELRDATGQPLGIVHRDVSPSNLFLTYQGSVKVLDFGIALALGRAEATLTGSVKGKASYMSPEQANGRRVDRRTDVWALGACLRELLTGTRAFEADSAVATLREVCERQLAPVSVLRPDLPPALDAVVGRALERDLEARFATAETFRAALEQAVPAAATQGALQAYLVELFGSERATRSLARGVASPRPASGETSELVLERQAATLETRVDPAVHPRPARWRWVLGALAGLGVMGAAALASRRAPVETRVAPAMAGSPAPAQVPVPVSAAAPAESPSAAPAPRKPPRRATPASVGYLVVTSELPATVRVDGRPRGSTPLPRITLPAGVHTLELQHAPLGLSRRARITIPANQAVSYQPDFGRTELHVTCAPWAHVFLDGVEVGQTPLAGYPLWEGRHRLRLVTEAGSKQLTLNAVPGKPLVVKESVP